MISVIIPTIEGREASLERLLASFDPVADQLEIEVVKGSPSCGAGWLEGVQRTSGEYVLYACDDQEFLSEDWPEVCIEAVEVKSLPCPRVWTPAGEIESQGGDMEALHHTIRRPRKDWTKVDYTTIPFLSREWAERIGMLPVHYASDVWVSYRGRQLGIETVLRHGFDVRHHSEQVGRGAGMSQAERDAMDVKTMREELARCES